MEALLLVFALFVIVIGIPLLLGDDDYTGSGLP